MIRTLAHPMTWMLALMPLIWIDIAKVGGFAINLPYVPALLFIGLAGLTPGMQRGAMIIASHYGIWLLAFVIYLPILMMSLAGSDAQGMPIRQVFFMTVALVVAAWVATGASRAEMFRMGGSMGLILVIVVIEILARRVNLSWIDAIMRFALSGDLNFVVYGFFRRVFNALSPGDEIAVGAAAKNALAVAVFTAGVMFRAGHKISGQDRMGAVVIFLVFGLLVMLNTRSVLLVAVLALPLVWVLGLPRRGGITVASLVAMVIIAFMLIVGIVLVLASDSAFISTMFERFSFTDSSAGSRFEQLEWAFGRIEHSLWLGSGYAEIDGHPVHNLFIGAWMHAGVLAFLLVVVFYLGLVLTWASFVVKVFNRPQEWHLELRAEWIAVLPLVPMFRVWLSGDAGHMNFVEWIAIGAFIGALAANREVQHKNIRFKARPLEILQGGQSG